jgi:predicted N-acetyltransferase YhbS
MSADHAQGLLESAPLSSLRRSARKLDGSGMTDEFRLARADELAAVFELRARAFERGTATDWAAYREQDPWRDAGADLVAVSDGRLVATVRVLARRLAGLDGELRLAGFGAVASDPAVRGQGYVRRLLALAHEHNRAAGYDLALLFTRSPWVYAGSAGFSILPCWWLDLDLHQLPPAVGAWTIAPAHPSRHLLGMRQVYEQFGRGRPGYPVRGDAYWTHPARLTDTSRVRVALDRDQHVAAYLRVRLAGDGPARLLECPYLATDAPHALVAELDHEPGLVQVARLGGRLPRDHALGRVGQWRRRDDAMACPYTAAGARLLAALHDPPTRRAVYWSGDGF